MGLSRELGGSLPGPGWATGCDIGALKSHREGPLTLTRNHDPSSVVLCPVRGSAPTSRGSTLPRAPPCPTLPQAAGRGRKGLRG